jgi:hypothetical protein
MCVSDPICEILHNLEICPCAVFPFDASWCTRMSIASSIMLCQINAHATHMQTLHR